MATNLCLQSLDTGEIYALNPTHLYKMGMNSVSAYPSDNHVNIALGHAACKAVKKLQGDKYTTWSQAESKDGTCDPTVKSWDLEGPSAAIVTGQKKVLLARMCYLKEACGCPGGHDETGHSQPPCWMKGTAGQTIRVDKLIHIIYDQKNAALVTPDGNVLYIARHHLVLDPKVAATDVENKQRFGALEGEKSEKERGVITKTSLPKKKSKTEAKTRHDVVDRYYSDSVKTKLGYSGGEDVGDFAGSLGVAGIPKEKADSPIKCSAVKKRRVAGEEGDGDTIMDGWVVAAVPHPTSDYDGPREKKMKKPRNVKDCDASLPDL